MDSAQWMSSNTTTSGSSAAIVSNSLRAPHAISSGVEGVSTSPIAATEPLRREVTVVHVGQEGSHVADLSGHLLERPVGDSLAVRQAPTD